MEESFNHSLNALQLQTLDWGSIDSPIEFLRRAPANHNHLYLLAAVILISLILHLVILRWVQVQLQLRIGQPQSSAPAQHKILIQLKKAQPTSSKLEAVFPVQITKPQIPKSSLTAPVQTSKPVLVNPSQVKARRNAIPSETAIEIETATVINLPQRPVSDEFQIPATDKSQLPFSGVFNPILRARLQEQNSKIRVQSGDLSWRAADNSVLIQVGDDHCLRSAGGTSNGNQRGTNWYHTNCGGKSDSEKFMDRVNAQLRRK